MTHRPDPPETREILAQLIAFDTVSNRSNMGLMDYVGGLLAGQGIEYTVIPDATGGKANLFATVGPVGVAGVMLSGHSDVVPVGGQAWTHPPFALTEQGGRLFGRGTADMKGFVACAIRAMLLAAQKPMKIPLNLALSYDEEIGCMGVRSLIEVLALAPVRPRFCIVGEPTGMQVATGHKGKIALRATCIGREGHSALAPLALNALHLAADFINEIRSLQGQIAATGRRDGDYDVPYTTVHVGKMQGGIQVNIVPNLAILDFEIRSLAEDDTATLIDGLRAAAQRITGPLQAEFPEAEIRVERQWDYPGLGTPPDAEVVRFVKGLTGANSTMKVAFGTEGGLFSQRLGVPTVICGPGSMAQGHKPDEFVTVEQMARCEAMLAALTERCVAGF